MGSVFAMQGIGQFTAAMVALCVTTGFKESLLTAKNVAACDGVCLLAVDKMWRVIIGFGAVPGCIALYFRLTIPETPRYTFDVARDTEKAVEDVKAYKSGAHEGKPDEVSRAGVLQDSRERLAAPKASWSDCKNHFPPIPEYMLIMIQSGATTANGDTERSLLERLVHGSSSMSLSTVLASTTPSSFRQLATPREPMCIASSATPQ